MPFKESFLASTATHFANDLEGVDLVLVLPLNYLTAPLVKFVRLQQPLDAVQGVVFGLHSHSFCK